MADYRTPLPALLAGMLEAGINQALALDQENPERLKRLDGRLLKLELQGLGISLFLTFEYGTVLVSLDAEREPDAAISGTPVALFAMAVPEQYGDWGLPGSGVSIQGDATLARDLGRVFSSMEADWAAPLGNIFGDTLGYQLAEGLRQGAAALSGAVRSTADFAGDYLREDPGVALSNQPFEEFTTELDQLRDGIDRFDVRLSRLEESDS